MTILTLTGKPLDLTGKPLDPTMMVKWSHTDTGGDPVKGSLRTIAHIDDLNDRAERRFGVPFTIIQPPFNTGVPASAGTHDFDCCIDWYLPGVPWWTAQRFGRANGLGCWYRHPPLFGNHLHGFTLPVPEGRVRSDDFATRVGVYVPGQLIDYYNHAFGLSGQHTPGSDKSWFPADIDATVFNLHDYIQRKRDDMFEKDDSDRLKRIEAAVTAGNQRDRERDQRLAKKIAARVNVAEDKVLEAIKEADAEATPKA